MCVRVLRGKFWAEGVQKVGAIGSGWALANVWVDVEISSAVKVSDVQIKGRGEK